MAKKDLKIKPLSDHLLIEPVKQETTTASGIVIPDTASKEKPQKGTVVAAGPGRTDDGVLVPMQVKLGDVVLYKKWGGTEVKLEDNIEYLLVKEEDVLAICL